MTVLHSVDFFPSGNASVAIEPRLPQADFPEHHHDFHEIVIVEHGTGIHVFNGQPYTITGGTVCFVRDHDRHLYEHTDNLCLTNVLYRSPDRFQFLAGLSLFGTALSAITFMAIPSKAYATNWSYVLFNTGIVFVAPVIVYVFIPFFRRLNITTAYEYLEIRFNVFIRVICSLAFIIFQVGRMGVVLFLPSIALNVVTGLDIFLCIGIIIGKGGQEVDKLKEELKKN